MKLCQIDRAVTSLCNDVEKIVKRVDFIDMQENQLIHELIICILGSGVRYEMCIAYAVQINQKKFLTKKIILSQANHQMILEVLSSPVRSSIDNKIYNRYRYPARTANFISQALFNIYNKYGSLKKLITSTENITELRRELIELSPGIGPKQASHFLKNIGYTNKVAIIDRHIMKYMELAGEDQINLKKLGTIKKYEEIETRFISMSSKFQYSIDVVDQAMWFVMRALGKENFT